MKKKNQVEGENNLPRFIFSAEKEESGSRMRVHQSLMSSVSCGLQSYQLPLIRFRHETLRYVGKKGR